MFVYIIDADFRLDDPNVINQQLLTFITSDPYVIQRQRILTSTAADKFIDMYCHPTAECYRQRNFLYI